MDRDFKHCCIALDVEIEDYHNVELSLDGQSFKGSDVPLLLQRGLADRLYALVANEIIASHLAEPGLIGMERPLVFVRGELWERLEGMSWTLREAIAVTEETKWPPIHSLPFEAASLWLHSLPGFDEGLGAGRVGRAVAALSHIIHGSPSEDSAVDLAWALLGLEALFTTGTEGLAYQLSAKSEVLLGTRTEHKKVVTQMYAFRSKFLHGSLDMPLAYRLHLSDEPAADFGPDAYECWRMGCTLLVASLQELVRRNAHTLEFSYTIV
jgi:hypothetical protein